ncbi:MAG TPA: hypothetical protein VET66_01220, partial [Steroidobacteraceae bacterium]|nr:hypothetical protein [Steroidobacteraceae bacterium]
MDADHTRAVANSPFTVGVSGHRDLDGADLPRLREGVTDFVRQLKAHLPDTDVRLIVGMAAGADLLVAETAAALGVGLQQRAARQPGEQRTHCQHHHQRGVDPKQQAHPVLT